MGNELFRDERKGLEAILFLESKGEGFVPAAFHRDEIGDIAIIWGHTTETLEDKGGRGLAHLRHKHNVDWGQLAAVIEKGTVSKQDNGRYAITSPRGGVVIVSPFYDAHKINWVVTARRRRPEGSRRHFVPRRFKEAWGKFY